MQTTHVVLKVFDALTGALYFTVSIGEIFRRIFLTLLLNPLTPCVFAVLICGTLVNGDITLKMVVEIVLGFSPFSFFKTSQSSKSQLFSKLAYLKKKKLKNCPIIAIIY